MEERKEIPQPLVGEILQARRLNQHQRGVIDFSDSRGLGIAIELPKKQAECIASYLTKEPPDKWYFWIYKEEGFPGRRGVVIAGPLSEQDKKSPYFLSDAQIARWFNQFLSPLGKITRVEEINSIGKLSFKVGGDKEVGFREIWDAFKEEERREKEGQRKTGQYKREIGRILLRKGKTSREGVIRHIEIGNNE